MISRAADRYISFGSGDAFPGILPDLTEEAAVALTTWRSETLQYAPRPGLDALRETIADIMVNDGANVSASEVQIVNGAKHGLELVCRILLSPGDTVVVTAPTYFTALPIFRNCGAGFVEVGRDREGIDVEDLEATLARLARKGANLPRLIYEIPDFHNPTGVTMSRRRREALVALSQRYDIPIVEDSPYRQIRFTDHRKPSLKSLSPKQVILLGTFAKMVAPGLRIGWVAASPDLLDRMAQVKSDGGTCPLTQRIVVEFCRRGRLPEQVSRMRACYREHRDRMFAALRRELPEVSTDLPDGGYYLWLSLPPGVNADELERHADGRGVGILSGSRFFADRRAPPTNRPAPTSFLRLAYSFASPDDIDEGIGRLATVMRQSAR